MNIFHQVPLKKTRPTLCDHLFAPEQRLELKGYQLSTNTKYGGNR
jgi:hypothetical protein